jgi:HAD superfamily hydrolase (TIGR01662 family)
MRQTLTVLETIKRTSALLLDFDGPICSIFSTLKNYTAAEKMPAAIVDIGLSLPPTVAHSKDPLYVMREAAKISSPGQIRKIDQALAQIERNAAANALPTPYAVEAMESATAAGVPIAIISNNSQAAIADYLTQHGLAHMIAAVIGRPFAKPDLMKPHPHSLLVAIELFDVHATQAVLVGDSTTDIEAAVNAGMLSTGFANKPHKLLSLVSAGATSTIDGNAGMAELVKAYNSIR